MIRRAFAALALSFVMAAPVQSATINYFEAGLPAAIPGLTGFATTGSMMDGLVVQACFTVLGCETRNWADTGANSGGVSGTGWGLSVTGDTFGADWEFAIGANVGQLISVLLDARTALTLFDRTFTGAGTSGSANGLDFTTALNGGTTIDVTYLNPTGVGDDAPVGDIFQQVSIVFRNESGPRTNWSFDQDTDNDSRFVIQVPEPATLLLLGLGTLALVRLQRRR